MTRRCHLAGNVYVLENLDCLGFSLILGERKQLAGGLGDLIKECLLCFQKGFPIIWQVFPKLRSYMHHQQRMQPAYARGRLSQMPPSNLC